MPSPNLIIRTYGDQCLRKKSTPVKEIGPAERFLIDAMIQTMYEEKGVGLAAPQIGINQRILVADIGEGPLEMVNPRILKKQGSWAMEEGCLSVPGQTIRIKRPQKILLKYLDRDNQAHEQEFEDLMARVILHEIDHLDGKLIVDYAGFCAKRRIKKNLEKNQKEPQGEESTII